MLLFHCFTYSMYPLKYCTATRELDCSGGSVLFMASPFQKGEFLFGILSRLLSLISSIVFNHSKLSLCFKIWLSKFSKHSNLADLKLAVICYNCKKYQSDLLRIRLSLNCLSLNNRLLGNLELRSSLKQDREN